jgi:hypothetical protein
MPKGGTKPLAEETIMLDLAFVAPVGLALIGLMALYDVGLRQL